MLMVTKKLHFETTLNYTVKLLKNKYVCNSKMEAKLALIKQRLEAVKANDQSWIPVEIPSNIREKCKATKMIRFDNNKKQWLVKKCNEEHFVKHYFDNTSELTYEEKKVYWELDATYDKEKDQFYWLGFQMN